MGVGGHFARRLNEVQLLRELQHGRERRAPTEVSLNEVQLLRELQRGQPANTLVAIEPQ